MIPPSGWTGMNLSDRDRRIDKDSIDRGEPLPPWYKTAVKVIDIFGNDTTKFVEVKV